MRKLLLFLACLLPGCAATSAPPADSKRPGEYVILLHGLARTNRSMKYLCKRLNAAGYGVVNLNYPSTDLPIEKISEAYLSPAVEECRAAGACRIHFVTHSLGGIVVRQFLSDHPMRDAGRVVMLGPPNRGSEVVDRMGSWTIFKWVNGPAGQQLGTNASSKPNTLPPPACDVGVIAGTSSINWYLSTMIHGRNDGKVSVESTKLSNMTDFATVATSHPFLMTDPRVAEMMLTFLETGRFRRTAGN